MNKLKIELYSLGLSMIFAGGGVFFCESVYSKENISHPKVIKSVNSFSNRSKSCPSNLSSLVDRMLKDLPSYANRIIQRQRNVIKNRKPSFNIIAAGKPEFETLKSKSSEYTSNFDENSQQVFFTTLERRYSFDRYIETQNYHKLILTPTEKGWQMVLMFSQFGAADKNYPPLPPQDTTNNYIGQAVSLWLRDCQS
jgi:hypothetical protein